MTVLVVASLFQLAVAAYLDIRQTQEQPLDSGGDLLQARGDQIVRGLDGFRLGCRRSAERLARFPEVMLPQTPSFCVAPVHHQALLGRSVSGGGSQSLGEVPHNLWGHT
jgi:hypothetical protein